MTKLTDKPASVESEWLRLFQFNSSPFCGDTLSSWAGLAELLPCLILNDCIVALTRFEYSPEWCTYRMTKLSDKPASAESEWLRLFHFNSSLFCSDILNSGADLVKLLSCVILNDCIVAITRSEYSPEWCTDSDIWLLHGWCHTKKLSSRRTFCVYHTAMHQLRVSLYSKPHTLGALT